MLGEHYHRSLDGSMDCETPMINLKFAVITAYSLKGLRTTASAPSFPRRPAGPRRRPRYLAGSRPRNRALATSRAGPEEKVRVDGHLLADARCR
jgi:hypothetical protein